MKDVLITIKSCQLPADGSDAESTELTTVGRLGQKDGIIYLTYDESDAIGAPDVKTVLRIENDDLVTLYRSGQIGGRLIVENEKRNICFYSIPQGSFTIGVYGKSVKSSFSGGGGTLLMKYTIDADTNLISENTVEISVKEVKK